MDIFELSEQLSQFFEARRKAKAKAKGHGPHESLSVLLERHFEEGFLRALALDYGLLPQEIEGGPFRRVVLELVHFILRSGQWDAFRAWLEVERPSILWADAVSEHSPFLPLTQTELAPFPPFVQASLLLNHHFSHNELWHMASQLDGTYDWHQAKYSYHKPQLTAVMLFYLAGAGKGAALVGLMQPLRPYVAAIQTLTWQEPDQTIHPATPDELFTAVKATPIQPPGPSRFHALTGMLAQNFTPLDLEEMCFDAGIGYDWLWSGRFQEKFYEMTRFLERTSLGPSGKAFIAACANRAPAVDWAQAVDLDKASLPSTDSVAVDGFYLARLRALVQQCLPDNAAFFDFVQAHFPYTRGNLSCEWKPGKNRIELIAGLKRRGRLPELLPVLEAEFPDLFHASAPYIVETTDENNS